MILENRLAALATLLEDRLSTAYDSLSPRAAALLLTLSSRGPLGIGFLAEVLGVRQPTVSRLLDGLQRQGLVERGAKQGRERSVSLTAEGRARAIALQRARLSEAGMLLEVLSPDQRAEFGALLDTMLAAATRGRRQARTTCRACDHGLCVPPGCPIDRRAGELETAEN